ncbi:MAG: type II toxin-antitoxin system HicB family antitoxin [Pseudomonadota bacterium]
MMRRYHINVFWHDADDCWVADVPDLTACSAFGDTPEQALAEVEVAMAGWLAAAEEAKLEIPQARYRPEIYTTRFAA